MKLHRTCSFFFLCALALLAGCGRSAGGVERNGVRFPADGEITASLAANFEKDPNTAQARTLLATLGGEKGQLDYAVRDVVSRGPVFEAHYDVGLRLGQAGSDSLNKLYAAMVPPAERAQLGGNDLAAHERWLAAQAQALEKTDPAQAQSLRATVEALGKCYRTAKVGDRVPLMEGLVASLAPSRNGWYAEKIAVPGTVLRCLPV
ncbi:MAG: hypothetical protein EOO25_01285 [Comamonadaceae bacterium]|nr:MAG: hypothetical protein EOO25_01285 [Comamonadaceae bacterium]